ncbi:MAG: carbon-nitrogen hydrolase family protein [Sulfurovum sp.]|nr:carbon-nitrogen hydrolase family protein [Sulfurovum sp.]
MPQKYKTLEVVSLQLSTTSKYQDNLTSLLSYLHTYEEKHIIIAPEVCLTGFDYAQMETSAKFSSKALKTLQKVINEQILILTLILKEGESFINQAVVIHKHKIIHTQEKVKLFKLADEDLYFSAGKQQGIKPFEIEGISYAILICFELRFKELWKQIEGVDVIFIPARWGKLRKNHLEILSSALAVMNQCYVVVSNTCDEDMASSSAIISPSGVSTRDDSKHVIESTIECSQIRKMRRYIRLD